jgi:ribosomal protein S18 acetylase RimI-like enzyme
VGNARSVRRLGPGDGPLLALLAHEDADFDLAGRGGARPPLSPAAASAYLADAQVLHWVAEEGAVVVGHLQCHLLRKRAGEGLEVLLYEIGVRRARRRQGVGRALLEALDSWMEDARVPECWVLADNAEAVAFYRACGFSLFTPVPTYMTRLRGRPAAR